MDGTEKPHVLSRSTCYTASFVFSAIAHVSAPIFNATWSLLCYGMELFAATIQRICINLIAFGLRESELRHTENGFAQSPRSGQKKRLRSYRRICIQPQPSQLIDACKMQTPVNEKTWPEIVFNNSVAVCDSTGSRNGRDDSSRQDEYACVAKPEA